MCAFKETVNFYTLWYEKDILKEKFIQSLYELGYEQDYVNDEGTVFLGTIGSNRCVHYQWCINGKHVYTIFSQCWALKG